ncbi:substrate-binding domain-containing protein [Clostridium sp. D46t1_190503_E9]|uniref:substrate-binding domain-containing protein n=1 Tax=Clostridium sp. D46t1_190503_E9 TaxID=2787137 RepID=UPI0018970BCC|nr:substrate-binding domain-containing protein [Clostridium sp. D46t1_190503_E9]
MKIKYEDFVYFIAIILLGVFSILTVGVIIFNNVKVDNSGEEKTYIIGVSQSQLMEPWQIKINEEIKKEASNYNNIQVIYLDAVGNSNKQIDDIDKLMNFDIDLLIISPSNSRSVTKKVSEVYKDIPVIVLDRGVEGYDYTLYIGPDNNTLGKQVGDCVLDLLEVNGGNIVEIKGDLTSNATIERSNGFRSRINQCNNINLVSDISVNWNRDEAEDNMRKIFMNNDDIDLVFAHNDAMALGAYNAYKNSNYKKDVKFIGIDGLTGEMGGVNLVDQGTFYGTFTCPTGGKEAIQYAIDILNKEKGIPKKVILRSSLITKENINEYKLKKETNKESDKITLGFCNVGNEGGWREANEKSIKNAASDFGIDLIYAEADLNYEKQVDILNGFIDIGVDIISFSPVKEEGFEEVLKRAKEANIPVILADRTINIEDKTLYNTFVGSDFKEEGRRAARWCIENLDKNINVFEIQGILGSTPTTERKRGFEEVVSAVDDIKIVESDSGNYTFEGGKKAMKNFLDKSYKKYSNSQLLVFSHNDDMALGAIEAIEEHGIKPGKDIKIVSIDAIKQGILAMKSGKINCIIECNPLIGPEIMKISKDILCGKDTTRMIITDEKIFEEENFDREWLNRAY